MSEKHKWSAFPPEKPKVKKIQRWHPKQITLFRKPKKHENVELKSLFLLVCNTVFIGIYVHFYYAENISEIYGSGITALAMPVIFRLIILLIFTIITFSGIVILGFYVIRKLINPRLEDDEKPALKAWYDIKLDADIILIAIVIIRLIIQPFSVYGTSMEPNFHNHQFIFTNEVSYKIHKPSRGDVVVFKYPHDKSKIYVKRIIGLPGERVTVENDKVTIYNQSYSSGIELKEDYIPKENNTLIKSDAYSDISLKSNEYYVLGDNREFSSDSREWGVLPSDLIIGKTWIVVWPFSDWKSIQTPTYNINIQN